ncbi:MAG: 16S rRNA (uracil(1498)-N(3))-methyltransferase [Gammaproteobacteria bacterium]|nr:16S rRNA (uracil(1498)-N(3))-methyltransferase [Gammaproteobacteria bacterium]NIR28320.1 16S rRNA (uracil(1498)-N(3))-methyltransferase [Gammaproteobacteria bacterium]NIR96734.1 16S rRNA (uracil(1498)-N(3))-methyltransferase [Gammaproteobacteria bacterium]NIT62436.1 16S rRNA (uracil(1498)-N(3))-methyltransferase [Gammaproteobacteria bacterium]NIV19369.1 16S rRNA (uracil(1498)-N(3))-methyltransferase [Gammaproteobacteria bacterium]
MRAPRIFTDRPLASGALVELDANPSHHLSRVLRMAPGGRVVIFDGRGGEYEAVLESADRRRVRLRVGRHDPREREAPLRLVLAQGVSRGERMDYTIQKAVELGVAEVVPLLSERSVVQLGGERAAKRQRHWRQVAISACEQCGRNRVPEVHAPAAFGQWLEARDGDCRALVMDPEGDPLSAADAPRGPVTLLVGPEGGLTREESARARGAGFQSVRLGPRVLRTETAAIAMLAALQTLWGDFR